MLLAPHTRGFAGTCTCFEGHPICSQDCSADADPPIASGSCAPGLSLRRVVPPPPNALDVAGVSVVLRVVVVAVFGNTNLRAVAVDVNVVVVGQRLRVLLAVGVIFVVVVVGRRRVLVRGGVGFVVCTLRLVAVKRVVAEVGLVTFGVEVTGGVLILVTVVAAFVTIVV